MKKFFLFTIFFLVLLVLFIPNCKHWRCSKIQTDFYSYYQLYLIKINEIENCKIENIKKIPKNSFLVIGHHYGKSKNVFTNNDQNVDKRLINLLKNNKGKINFLILNGDIFEKPSVDKWLNLISFFESQNLNFYIAPGNHDIIRNIEENNNKIFNDLFSFQYPLILNLKENIFYIRDTTSMNWSLKKEEVELINKFDKKNIYIVQHHTGLNELRFLTHDKALSKSKSNKKILRIKELKDQIDKNKKINFIIGDSGMFKNQKKVECKKFYNFEYIISGLGGDYDDKILIISDNKIFYYDLN